MHGEDVLPVLGSSGRPRDGLDWRQLERAQRQGERRGLLGEGSLTELGTARVSDDTRKAEGSVSSGGEDALSVLAVVADQVGRSLVTGSRLE